MSERDLRKLERLMWWTNEGSGYFQIQATRPQTIAAGLSDSPVGQLAWMLDAFKSWTAGGTATGVQLDRQTVLAHVSLYWLTNTAASSARNYWENMHSGGTWAVDDEARENEPANDTVSDAASDREAEGGRWGETLPTPVGVAVFGEDIAMRQFGEQAYTIVHWSEFDEGGHFAALETPALLVGDVRGFFRKLRA